MANPVSPPPTSEPFAFPAELLKALTFVVNKATERINREVESVVTPHNLTFRQYGLLLFLRSEGPQAQVEISRQVGLDPTSVMRTVDLLETRGLVRRDPDPGDRRKHSVVLTKSGSELLAHLSHKVQQAEDALYAVLSEQERVQLLALLRRLLPANEKAA